MANNAATGTIVVIELETLGSLEIVARVQMFQEEQSVALDFLAWSD